MGAASFAEFLPFQEGDLLISGVFSAIRGQACGRPAACDPSFSEVPQTRFVA
jgi:hypothetical protein